jgi:thiol-disulfide isomerase/thioredoxin
MIRRLYMVLLIVMLAGLGWWVTAAEQEKGPKPGTEVQSFSLNYLNKSGKVVLKNYFCNPVTDSNKLVVLTFFASWCKPCKLELPHLEEVYKKYHTQGLEIMAVFSEKESDKVQWAKDWFKENNLEFSLLHDEFGIVKKRFEIEEYPTSYIINRHGVIVRKMTGYYDEVAKEFDSLMDSLLVVKSDVKK